MILDVDAGNTRLKWRVSPGDGGPAVAWGATGSRSPDFSILRAWGVQRVRMSSVLCPSMGQGLSGMLMKETGCRPAWAQTKGAERGLINAYADPSRLGVDRWLAMLAAWEWSQGAVCVVDAGTTLTLDAINAAGKHLGGYIVPGVAMMEAALYGDTGQVHKMVEVGMPTSAFGVSTEQAVTHGALAMLVSLIRFGVEQLAAYGDAPDVVLTGGDADFILEHLPFEVRYRRDLVLDGLALQLP